MEKIWRKANKPTDCRSTGKVQQREFLPIIFGRNISRQTALLAWIVRHVLQNNYLYLFKFVLNSQKHLFKNELRFMTVEKVRQRKTPGCSSTTSWKLNGILRQDKGIQYYTSKNFDHKYRLSGRFKL